MHYSSQQKFLYFPLFPHAYLHTVLDGWMEEEVFLEEPTEKLFHDF